MIEFVRFLLLVVKKSFSQKLLSGDYEQYSTQLGLNILKNINFINQEITKNPQQ